MTQPAQRVIIVGASNVALGMRSLISACQQQFDGPIEYMIAAGHGRSLGMKTQVVVRSLPGVNQCALWSDLKSRPEIPTYALVTDIGNDLAYGISPEILSVWVKELLQRLFEHQAQTVIALPPIDTIRAMQRWKFEVMRRVFFPQSPLQFDDALRFAIQLSENAENISNFFSMRTTVPNRDWYGFDPIHIRRRFHDRAWSFLTRGWFSDDVFESRTTCRIGSSALWRLAPHQRWLFGREQLSKQPCWTSKSVGSISLY